MECWSYLPYLYCGCRFISNACSRLYFSHYFWILCWKSLPSEHKIEFLRLMVEELQTLQAKGLIFLIMFLSLTNEHKIQFLRLTVWELKCLQATGLIFHIIFRFFVENHLLTNKNPVSMTYGLRVTIIAGNGPYFSHYFQFLCWKTQTPVSTTYGFRVLCLIHSCGVITHCRVNKCIPW